MELKHSVILTVHRTHERPGWRAVASNDLQRQANELHSTWPDPLQVKPFNEPYAGTEQGLMSLLAIGRKATDGKVVDPDEPYLPLHEILGRCCRKVYEVLEKAVDIPAVL